MPFWPDLVFQLLPGFGLLCSCTSLIYLFIMRRAKMDGFFSALYTCRAIDMLLGLSLFYTGFYGIHLTVQYGNEQDAQQMPPFRCLFTALHLYIWVFIDTAQLLLLAILCADQFISVAWTKRHKEISEYYFHPGSILLLLFLSCGAFVPAWFEPISLAENDTVQISSFCSMPEALGEDFYDIELEVRKWAPLAAVAVLCLTGCSMLGMQLVQRGRFKWSDDNRQSARFFSLILCRALLLAASVHLPLLHFHLRLSPLAREPDLRPHLQDPRNRIESRNGSVVERRGTKADCCRQSNLEIAIRVMAAILFGLVQPLLDALLLPQFLLKIGEFLNLNEVKRTWQSADDPPPPHRSVGTSGWDMFGSFHSITGNIIGEAGLPMELNADVQRSVSFYYRDEAN